jgi:hypothetical protein
MRFQSMIFLAAALLVGLAASPAIAKTAGGSGCLACVNGGPVPAPGPVAGAGLGYLVLAGGYYAVRRWRKQNTGE